MKLDQIKSTLGKLSKIDYKAYLDRLILSCNHYWPIVKERLGKYAVLCRMHKPIGVLLLLWPTLWALWIAAEGVPETKYLIIFILGVFLTRSAGCVMNDLADRDIDKYVGRTKDRPITTGDVSVKEALMVTTILMSIAFILVLFTNELTVYLSCIALLLAAIYPLMKRYTYLPQFVLGVAFGWGIPMAFAAQTGSVPVIAWLILIANVLWSVVYDTMYAMVDRQDDIKIGVKSTAILFAEHDTLIIAIIQCMLILTLILIGQQLEMGKFYYLGVTAAILLALYHQNLIKDRKPENCFKAFLHNNWFGAVIFIGIFFNYQFNAT